ncbi:hypothetical protein ACKI1Q_44920, partial [Streptomyces galilaeus]|uniref:hypothetical protein n=1 Tax=Streptomyces galilaeus TaxID=33899 RepID=UPI0038F6E7C5
SHLDTHTALSGANSNSLYNPASATGYVRVATTGNIALNFNTTIVDGVPLHTNDLVLVWQQADKTQNGVYLVNLSPTINGGNWLRAG